MYLFDTNHCSAIIFGNLDILRRVTKVGESLITTSVITRGELIFMAQNSEQRSANLARVKEFLKDIGLYFVDEETADIYGEFKADIIAHFGPKERNKRRKTTIEQLGISDNDLWIAAIALRHHLTIVSQDSDFERMRQVRELAWEFWL
ncbi:type II toxin-antitoxin system VapC family toxin [Nostoc sp. WHI]|nr:type II toxin-antitoxin system VapC family toxin [Nostoc sp. WHI]MBG1269598.1 type II toxin-antitoxin system VapC family toxin [Nostoc sp. WHI]